MISFNHNAWLCAYLSVVPPNLPLIVDWIVMANRSRFVSGNNCLFSKTPCRRFIVAEQTQWNSTYVLVQSKWTTRWSHSTCRLQSCEWSDRLKRRSVQVFGRNLEVDLEFVVRRPHTVQKPQLETTISCPNPHLVSAVVWPILDFWGPNQYWYNNICLTSSPKPVNIQFIILH